MIGEGEPKSFHKRPKLLSHQFNLERQNILLLSTKGSSTSEVISAQESKISQFSAFIDSIEDLTNEKGLFEGVEMLLRSIKMIKSTSKQNLLLKLCKFKLKIVLNQSLGYEILEDSFNECVNNSNTKTTIECFEEYFGIHPQLDSLICVKILEFSSNLDLQEKIKICLDFQKKRERQNILKELMKTVLHDLKRENVVIDANIISSLLDLNDNFSIETLTEYLMTIYNTNKLEFLENSRIFNKFLEILKSPSLRDSSQFSSIITGFNSRIRSFLSRPEAKKEGVVFNCTKFVLEFYELGIGCIGQFADFILKCQLIKFEELCTLTRRLIYKLLLIHLKRSGKTVEEVKFDENLSNNLNLQLEFIQEMIENLDSKGFKGDFLILTVYPEYLDEKYICLLEKYLKRYEIAFGCYEEFDEEDFFIDLDNENNNIEEIVVKEEIVIEGEFVNFLFNTLYPIYMKKFKGSIDKISSKFIKVLSIIMGILLEHSKVTWTDLSGTFGPNSAASCSKWEGRAVYCKIYNLLSRMKQLKTNLKTTIKNVLNPRNCAEYWLKCLFDFQDYGQVDFFNEYFGIFITDKMECFKRKTK